MSQSRKDRINGFFGSLTEFRPESFEEYNKTAGKELEKIADCIGIAAAVYEIQAPKGASRSDTPHRAVLYKGREESEEEPAVFTYTFAANGRVKIMFYPVKGSTAAEERTEELRLAAGMLNHVLNTLLLDELYSRLMLSDPATGIPNLAAFIRFCTTVIGENRLGEYTALYFNIHNFKSIHQSLSYIEGNNIMAIYCNIVAGALTEREICARLGGDTFVAMVLNKNKDYFLDLIGNMAVKYKKDDRLLTFFFGATVGAASLGEETDYGEIMMEISTAYQSAREQRINMCYYDKSVSVDMIGRKIILSKFFRAAENREFKVYYQPKVEIKSMTLKGAEALVRWIRPDGGMIMPGSFIPVLENDGCICTLDFYMLEEVCRFQKRLREEGIEPVKISVNFSKRHLANNRLVEEIVEKIDKYDVPHGLIEIELTESESSQNSGVMKEVVDELNSFGIVTSIDDFGTGYSSLGMLRTLELDTLKIDRSFIPMQKNGDDEKNLVMLRGVVSLAKSLGLTTVAEGVETPEQLSLMESMDCDIVQGYIFDRPLPEEEFIERLRRRIYEVPPKGEV